MSDPIDILFCANPGYFQHLAVTAVSLSESNRESRLKLHILTCDRDMEREVRLRETLERLSNVTYEIHVADDGAIGAFFVDGFITKEAYLRLIAPDLLPAEVRRLIYLDCDLLVLDDIRPLWTLDLVQVIAAAPDYPRLEAFMSPVRRDILGIPKDATYVNSGVLVMDIDRWRSEGLTRRFVDYVQRMGSHLAFYDQDAINAVLAGRIQLLDPRWNLQARMYRVGRRSFPEDFDATKEARKQPAIIHFTGSEKPWLFRSRVAKKGLYFKYLGKTAWRNRAAPVTRPLDRAEHAFGVFLATRFDLDYVQAVYKVRRATRRMTELLSPRQDPVKG